MTIRPSAPLIPDKRRNHRRGVRLLLRSAFTLAGGAFALLGTSAQARAGQTALKDPDHARVASAGYTHKFAKVNRIKLSYWEGPDNGPPLVLLHAQLLDWFAYSKVLPELAQKFHVYDVDYPGHGETVTPADYRMDANQIGADLGDFIQKDIGKPVFVTGNSSGGLLATWLAANRPKLIRKALLEDPPLFSSEYPAIKSTIADKAFLTSYTAATKDHPDDFLLYWIRMSKEFFRRNAGPGVAFVLTKAIEAFERNHPGQPVELSMLMRHPTVFMMIRGLSEYDPRFGAAFYDGTWNEHFDHAQALAKITCPVLLMQANWSIDADGMLKGAMTQAQADKAMALLKHGTYDRIDASHVINLEAPNVWLKAAESFFLGK